MSIDEDLKGSADQFCGLASPSLSKGAEVFRMADFDAIRPSQILTELRAYWESLRHGRAIPYRSDIEPKGLRKALDYAFILERLAPGAARFRLAGKHLIDLMGMEVRGMPLCSLVNPRARGRLSDVLESVFKAPQIAQLRLRSESAYAQPELDAHMLLLPLRSDLGDTTRILGCMVSEGELGRGPRRFDILHDAVFPVIEGAAVIEPSPSGFAEPPAPWRAAPAKEKIEETPEERRARFRIVVSNARKGS